MSTLEIILLCLGIFLFLSICVYLYYFVFETKRTKIIRYVYENKSLTKVKNAPSDAIKIVFFSDIHIGRALHGNQLKSKIDWLYKLNGDIYIFGGDLIGYKTPKYFSSELITSMFTKLTNKPCFKVYGNHEFIVEDFINQDQKDRFFKALPFTLLENTRQTIELKNKTIDIIGLHEREFHKPSLPKLEGNNLRIVVLHQADAIDELDIDADIILAGHTHGGQIKLPFFKPLYLPIHGKKYLNGVYKVKNSHLIVSKGIGCNMIKFRFFAASDIIELYIK